MLAQWEEGGYLNLIVFPNGKMQLKFTFVLGHFNSKYNISGDFNSMLTLKN